MDDLGCASDRSLSPVDRRYVSNDIVFRSLRLKEVIKLFDATKTPFSFDDVDREVLLQQYTRARQWRSLSNGRFRHIQQQILVRKGQQEALKTSGAKPAKVSGLFEKCIFIDTCKAVVCAFLGEDSQARPLLIPTVLESMEWSAMRHHRAEDPYCPGGSFHPRGLEEPSHTNYFGRDRL